MTVAVNRGDKVEAGALSVAGLNTIGALDLAEQVVVVAHRSGACRPATDP